MYFVRECAKVRCFGIVSASALLHFFLACAVRSSPTGGFSGVARSDSGVTGPQQRLGFRSPGLVFSWGTLEGWMYVQSTP
ncbi:hypothetical protein V8C37DRAFT_386258 [Trichoderma ceciliae]